MKKHIYKIIELLERSCWNIGFAVISPEQLLNNPALLSQEIHWLEHPYHDRFFADPFFLNVDSDYIEVMVEEYMFASKKGHLVILKINRSDYRLVERRVLLNIGSHLSYPIDFQYDNIHYLYPENGICNRLPLYKFKGEALEYVCDLITPQMMSSVLHDSWLSDATMVDINHKYYILANLTKTNDKLIIFTSDSPLGRFTPLLNLGVKNDVTNSRPAGKIFKISGNLFRPVQNCTLGYGRSICIQKINSLTDDSFDEELLFEIQPLSFKYNRGIHTLNFKSGLCVVDGRGYRYPIARYILPFIYCITRVLLFMKKCFLKGSR